jgi:hypothetical protein
MNLTNPPVEHLIGSEERIDVPRSCALVIHAITLVCKVTSGDAHGDKPLPARLLTLPVTDATVTAFAGLLNVVHEIMSAIAICSIVTRQPACQSQLRL